MGCAKVGAGIGVLVGIKVGVLVGIKVGPYPKQGLYQEMVGLKYP